MGGGKRISTGYRGAEKEKLYRNRTKLKIFKSKLGGKRKKGPAGVRKKGKKLVKKTGVKSGAAFSFAGLSGISHIGNSVGKTTGGRHWGFRRILVGRDAQEVQRTGVHNEPVNSPKRERASQTDTGGGQCRNKRTQARFSSSKLQEEKESMSSVGKSKKRQKVKRTISQVEGDRGGSGEA